MILVDSNVFIEFWKNPLDKFDDTENIYISAMSVGVLYEKVLAAPKTDEKLENLQGFLPVFKCPAC